MGWSLCVDRLTSQIIQSYLVPVVLKYTRQCINNSLSCVDILSSSLSIERTWQGLVHATRSAGPLPPSEYLLILLSGLPTNLVIQDVFTLRMIT